MSQAVSNKSIDEALAYANIAAIIAVLVLESSDSHHKQAIICIERAMITAKDRASAPTFTKEHEKRFADILMKIKKANLAKDEKLVPTLPVSIELELSIYESLAFE